MADDDDQHDDDDDETYYEYLKEQRATFRHQTPDIDLAGLAHPSKDIGFITVFVGGAIVTGRPVQHSEWLGLAAEISGDGDSTDIQEWIAEEKLRDAVEEVPIGERKYLHLADADIVLANGAVTELRTLWRGRLASIDAWMFGQLRTPET